jgi:hypothetical protein
MAEDLTLTIRIRLQKRALWRFKAQVFCLKWMLKALPWRGLRGLAWTLALASAQRVVDTARFDEVA